ncbi:MAG: vitamin K epoxide reductase family protein, partial [Patescibacteria group bacterium]
MILLPFIFAAALAGLADSAYLAVEHYRGAAAFCLVTTGCDKVLTSAFAVIAGVPVAVLGVVFYAGVLIAACLFYRAKSVRVLATAF